MYQLTENIIAIEVPEDAIDFSIGHIALEPALWFKQGENMSSRVLSEGEFILIGVTPLSVRECAKVVEKWDRYFPMKHTVYRNYLKPVEYSSVKQSTEQGWSDCFGLPTESFDTLIESKGLDPNKKYAIIKIEKK